MSWLARIEINIEDAFTNCFTDNYTFHQRIWECFPNSSEKKRDFLTRFDHLEETLRFWLLARTKPARPSWCNPENFTVKEISPSFLSYQHYAFDLLANPTKCISIKGADGVMPRHGKRVPIVNLEDLRKWLERKGETGGFIIVADKQLEVGPVVDNHFRKKSNEGCHVGVQFRGVLSVTDSVKFSETYYTGLGSAKAFGFGMLLLAPLKR